MALTGTLSDLGIVDLLRFPSAAGKTGELIIAGMDEEARLYYDHGVVHHASCGDEMGIEAIVKLVAFSEGEFEFRNDVTTAEHSIEIPIAELVSQAMEIQKTRASEAKVAAQVSVADPAKAGEALVSKIIKAAVTHQYIEHVALYTKAGELIFKWDRNESDPLFEASIGEVVKLLQNHPRKGLNKVYFTDTQGTIVATVINDETILLLNAESISSLGMISLAATKLTQIIIDNG